MEMDQALDKCTFELGLGSLKENLPQQRLIHVVEGFLDVEEQENISFGLGP